MFWRPPIVLRKSLKVLVQLVRHGGPLATFLAVFLFSAVVTPVHASIKHKHEDYGKGFSTEVSAPEAEVLEAVRYVVNNGMIEGSKEYVKDKFIDKAVSEESSPLFPEWKDPGTVLYKVRAKVLAPENFEDSNDEGTLAVRYVIQKKDATRTILKIDALFREDFHRRFHGSNGSVETAEYKSIEDRLETMESDKKKTEESARHREEELAKKALERKNQEDEAAALAASLASADSLEQHVQKLRRQVERVVKAPGAQLKSAPFHTASNLRSLEAGQDVVILVVTPYWYGIETEDGQHGWLQRAQLESLP